MLALRWRALRAAVWDALFPPRCVGAGCGRIGTWLCPSCLAAIPPLPAMVCERCGRPVARPGACPSCRRAPPPYRRATAAGAYAGVLREAIHALKYRGIRDLAGPLGELAAQAHGAILPGTLVVPVPAHRRRVAWRGLDHARLLATTVAGRLDGELAGTVLQRTRPTAPQVGLAPEARRQNVSGAFAAGGDLGGRRVVLVDDVLTTGATVEACAQALLAAGAAAVDVCTVARALGQPRSSGWDGTGPTVYNDAPSDERW